MTDLIELLQQSISELEQTGSELRTGVQTALILIRSPVGVVRDLNVQDLPDAPTLKKSLTALRATLEHTQEVAMRMIDKITVASGTTQMLIDEIQND